MQHGRDISIETLGELVAHDYGMNAMCERCRRRADLDMQALITKLGVGFRYVDPNLERSRCGEKAVSIQIHYLNSARSRFAD
jgi:hypothetical protein